MAEARNRGDTEARSPKTVKEPVAAPTTLARGISASSGTPPKPQKA